MRSYSLTNSLRYKLQYTEACEEKEKLKLSIDHERSRITELTNQYETQFNAIRSAHELEKENIRLSHIKSLDDIRKVLTHSLTHSLAYLLTHSLTCLEICE